MKPYESEPGVFDARWMNVMLECGRKYRSHKLRDDERVKNMNAFELAALAYQLHTGQFNIVPYMTEGYVRWMGYCDNIIFLHIAEDREQMLSFLLIEPEQI